VPHLADRGGHLHWRGNVQGRAPFVLALYVAGASGLATAGDTRSTALLLAAVAVTLPLGVIAFVLLFAAVALANGVVLRQFWLGARVGRQKPARR